MELLCSGGDRAVTALAVIPPRKKTEGERMLGSIKEWTPETYRHARHFASVMLGLLDRTECDSEMANEMYHLKSKVRAYEAERRNDPCARYDGEAGVEPSAGRKTGGFDCLW